MSAPLRPGSGETKELGACWGLSERVTEKRVKVLREEIVVGWGGEDAGIFRR
jgi:hypothetical protein